METLACGGRTATRYAATEGAVAKKSSTRSSKAKRAPSKKHRTKRATGVSRAVTRWLRKVCDPDTIAGHEPVHFQSEEHLEHYLDTLDKRTEPQVVELLERLLMPSAAFGLDEIAYEAKNKFPKFDKGIVEPDTGFRNQFLRRREAYFEELTVTPPWEGNSWIIDLLPRYPGKAIQVLDHYLLAHICFLPDGRIYGLNDAITLIRAKFIGVPKTISAQLEFLKRIDSRQFECVVERLYASMGYTTELTAPAKDGGRDVIATRMTPGKRDNVQIECKRYSSKVGVPIIRQLLGVVADTKSPRGVLVALSGFTKPATKFAARNPRIELLPGDTLVSLLNEHLGSRWHKMIERLVLESERRKLHREGLHNH